MILHRPLGRTGLHVSALGLGAGPLGDVALDDASADRLIREALELGVSVIDTAPSYGASEVRIGRVLSSLSAAERDAVVVVTKGGYGVPGVAEWTPEVIERGIVQALGRLATDRIDVFLLHSCPLERLVRGDLLAPLERMRRSGAVRAVGYSGDGDALAWAVRCETFDVIECSVNLVDQEALDGSIPHARSRGVGVLGKRSLAGAPWISPPSGSAQAYVERWQQAFGTTPIADTNGLELEEVAVRFAAYATGVDCALVGTRRSDRLRATSEHVARGPLPAATVADIAARFAAHGATWPGVI